MQWRETGGGVRVPFGWRYVGNRQDEAGKHPGFCTVIVGELEVTEALVREFEDRGC